MATSGSKSIAATSQDTLKFSWWQNSQSITNNTTTIGWKLELIASSSGYISSSVAKDWSVTVNGTKYSGTNKIGISNNATKTLASGTTTITHNSDGTKTFSYSFSQEFAITWSGSYIGTKSGSGSGTLNTIPRKSTLAANNGTLGTAQTLTVTRQSTSFTHTITYKCGDVSGTICTKSTSTSISWTPQLSLAEQNKTGTSVSVIFTITTYNGSTSLGSNTKTISCTIPSSVKPTVSFTVEDGKGYLSTYGGYVQGQSTFKIAITTSGSYGSSIKSYKTTADDKTYTVASFTSPVISGSGTLTISVTVTDSRGRTATATKTVTVLEYKPPVVTDLVIRRSGKTGTSNASGEYLAVDYSVQITSLDDKNSAHYYLWYKKVSETEYTIEELTSIEGAYVVLGLTTTFLADKSSSYDVRIVVEDNFYKDDSAIFKNGKGSSASKLWSILRNGLGFAFGKVAELEGFLEINFKTFFYKFIVLKNMVAIMMENAEGQYRDVMHMTATNNLKIGYDSYDKSEGSTDICGKDINFMSRNGIWINGQLFADFVIEQGTSGIWTYRKWNSGIAECWAYSQITFNTSTSSTGISGFNMVSVEVPLPFDFIAYPCSTCSCVWNFTEWVQCHCNEHRVLVRQICNSNSANVNPKYVSIQVKGRWKE